MSSDVFGNLREWGGVPGQIAELTAGGKLDDHQAGLVRILRYRDNWRLREMVLKAVGNLHAPSTQLLSEVLAVVADEGLYYETRVLASQALASLFARRNIDYTEDRAAAIRRRAVETMKTVLDSPGPPVLHNAVRKCLATICSGA